MSGPGPLLRSSPGRWQRPRSSQRSLTEGRRRGAGSAAGTRSVPAVDTDTIQPRASFPASAPSVPRDPAASAPAPTFPRCPEPRPAPSCRRLSPLVASCRRVPLGRAGKGLRLEAGGDARGWALMVALAPGSRGLQPPLPPPPPAVRSPRGFRRLPLGPAEAVGAALTPPLCLRSQPGALGGSETGPASRPCGWTVMEPGGLRMGSNGAGEAGDGR